MHLQEAIQLLFCSVKQIEYNSSTRSWAVLDELPINERSNHDPSTIHHCFVLILIFFKCFFNEFFYCFLGK